LWPEGASWPDAKTFIGEPGPANQGTVEYVRADIADAQAEELEAEVERLKAENADLMVRLEQAEKGGRRGLKGWACAQDFSCQYGSWLLVVAPTPGKARQAYMSAYPETPDRFTDIGVRRAPAYDGMTDTVSAYIENDDIPEGFPPFYTDEEGDFG
jgi:hypothetical protein